MKVKDFSRKVVALEGFIWGKFIQNPLWNPANISALTVVLLMVYFNTIDKAINGNLSRICSSFGNDLFGIMRLLMCFIAGFGLSFGLLGILIRFVALVATIIDKHTTNANTIPHIRYQGQKKICPRCENAVEEGLDLCPYCGSNLKVLEQYQKAVETRAKSIKAWTESIKACSKAVIMCWKAFFNEKKALSDAKHF